MAFLLQAVDPRGRAWRVAAARPAAERQAAAERRQGCLQRAAAPLLPAVQQTGAGARRVTAMCPAGERRRVRTWPALGLPLPALERTSGCTRRMAAVRSAPERRGGCRRPTATLRPTAEWGRSFLWRAAALLRAVEQRGSCPRRMLPLPSLRPGTAAASLPALLNEQTGRPRPTKGGASLPASGPPGARRSRPRSSSTRPAEVI
mmetsp:Transcript_11900/g.35929  ORF Transcript_11900/g.35929 Transcript_11900/m.35929 type:complete len:204 (-) Transcript_11900:1762-2373(-)